MSLQMNTLADRCRELEEHNAVLIQANTVITDIPNVSIAALSCYPSYIHSVQVSPSSGDASDETNNELKRELKRLQDAENKLILELDSMQVILADSKFSVLVNQPSEPRGTSRITSSRGPNAGTGST